MRRLAATSAAFLVVLLTIAGAAQASAPAMGPPTNEKSCGVPAEGHAACLAVDHRGKGAPVAPSGYGAADLQSAYGLNTAAASNGAGVTVAIVDAYDDPNAYKDLSQYRTTEKLPAIASCAPSQLSTSISPCFAKVNQSGAAASYPTANSGWAEEIALDVDMVSATCPNCNILLVEASSNNLSDLGAAVVTAASFHPVSIGNSYGGPEYNGEVADAQSYYAQPGIAITASSGDSGYGAEFPASAASVVAVGGTSLRKQTGGSWSQTVWSGAGSGCSAYIPKPSWQHDTAGCPRRTVADVAAVADPNTGVKVYDTFKDPGWMIFGGTSASAQIVSGIYGLAGHGADSAASFYGGGAIPFGGTNPLLTDVTSGSNGSCAGRKKQANPALAYLCTGTTGYDGPTGMGTPIGIGSF